MGWDKNVANTNREEHIDELMDDAIIHKDQNGAQWSIPQTPNLIPILFTF